MNILTLDHIQKSYTGRMLFDDASFYLQEGEKVGILGINGTGKSTLLRIIAGLEEPDAGKVIRAGNVTVQMLVQSPEFEMNDTVLEAVMRSHVIGKFGETADTASMEAKAKSMLMKLGFTEFHQPVEQLSGGQKKKVALVSVLLHQSDILVLDEPTNHLDAEMSDWLEDVLKNYRGTLVMVTHDRYFLDSVSNRIVEIDRGSIYSYDTNYSGFLERKAQREEMQQASERKRQSILRTELEWVKRGARARTTKQKARLERYEELKNRQVLAADGAVEISSVSSRMGKTTVELHDICKAYGNKVLLRDFTYSFLRSDRVGFVGENGCGKTTLMKMIATAAGASVGMKGFEAVYPDAGTITIGQTIKIGYYSQEIAGEKEAGIAYMDPAKRVIDYVRDTAEFVQTVDGTVSATKMCERFLFDSEQQYSLIGKLSGGQKRRLNLLRVLMEAPNVLILDEPTNDLDIRTLTILEDYLDSFDGIVITVSHDRYFLDRCVRRIFAFEGDGVLRQYEGGYTDYQIRREMEGASEQQRQTSGKGMSGAAVNEVVTKKEKPRTHQLKLSYKEQKEYDTIEDEIASLEEKIGAAEADIVKFARDFVKLNELTKEKDVLQQKLDEKMERWMYLEELVAKIEEERNG
ncbi:MAG: ABC-F family ATP-binding cassette domain-containing protein [Lachnospiraceae bacterium]|nr:ABC-F family ATP-binding cassette domain-containing protein [Lachnospiraceae bacterium]